MSVSTGSGEERWLAAAVCGLTGAQQSHRPVTHFIEEILQLLAGATWFSKLHLASAYHQVALTETSRELITFLSHEGLFRFKRVCFGLAFVPATFQKLMANVMKGCLGVVCYLDDIVV